VDRAIDALHAAATPLTTGELLAATGSSGSVRAAVQKLSADDRLIRTGRNRWALAGTGETPYSPLAPKATAEPRHRRPPPALPPATELLRPPHTT
jgi:hypothetical protein